MRTTDLCPCLPCSKKNRSQIQHINLLIARAEKTAEIPSNPIDWWRGSLQETAFSAIHQARVESIGLLDNDEKIRARAQEVVLKSRKTLPKDDPRPDQVSKTVLRRKSSPRTGAPNASGLKEQRPAIASLAGAVYRQADQQYAQSRSYRNRLVRLIGIALLSDAVVLVAAFLGVFAFEGNDTVRTTVLIALFGAIGAFLSAVQPLARNPGCRNPLNLPMYQLILKLSLGPLFALLGVAMITTQTAHPDSAHSTALQLLVWASGFGMAQQLVTHQVDQKVRGLLAPGNPKDASADGG